MHLSSASMVSTQSVEHTAKENTVAAAQCNWLKNDNRTNHSHMLQAVNIHKTYGSLGEKSPKKETKNKKLLKKLHNLKYFKTQVKMLNV